MLFLLFAGIIFLGIFQFQTRSRKAIVAHLRPYCCTLDHMESSSEKFDLGPAGNADAQAGIRRLPSFKLVTIVTPDQQRITCLAAIVRGPGLWQPELRVFIEEDLQRYRNA